MPTEAKRETIADLRAQLDASRTMIVSEYRGLKVKEISEIRRALRKQDVSYRVVKNRLMRIAAQDSPAADALSPLLVGPTAIAFGTDEAATAKAVLDADAPLPHREDHGRRAGVAAHRRGRRDQAGNPALARGAPRPRRSGPSWRRCPRRPACSTPRCGTSPGSSQALVDKRGAAAA